MFRVSLSFLRFCIYPLSLWERVGVRGFCSSSLREEARRRDSSRLELVVSLTLPSP
jgi:hypothetical protein